MTLSVHCDRDISVASSLPVDYTTVACFCVRWRALLLDGITLAKVHTKIRRRQLLPDPQEHPSFPCKPSCRTRTIGTVPA